jgi:HTH-type transcriptional regulator/antitoxin HipB
MNIEVANRLVNLRKQMGLSQEQLAEKIGVSRQAVSKWERSEASPDTDNLILLARLYNVSLDDLLKTDDEIPTYDKAEKTAEPTPETESSGFDNENDYAENTETNRNEYNWDKKDGINVHADNGDRVHIGFDGIHVVDHKGTSVHVGLDGIRVNENAGENVTVDKNGVFINGEKQDVAEKMKKHALVTLPIVSLCFIAFLGFGFAMNGWWYSWLCLLLIPFFGGITKAIAFRKSKHLHETVTFGSIIVFFSLGLFMNGWSYCWLTLLLIPILTSLIDAIRKRKLSHFAFPVLVVFIYLAMGMFMTMWHPGWVIFFSIPVYYWIANLFKNNKKHCNCDECQ